LKIELIKKVKVNLFGLLLFILPSTLFAAQQFDEQWLKLLRYNKSIFGYESEVDYPKYFLAKDGKENPTSELKATIKAFHSKITSDINNHPVCTFPGRYKYLYKKNKVPKFNLNLCTDFQYFRKKLNLNSVSLVFSSYYINKPASAFGHTFLKLNQGDAKSSDLNSYGVDFSAQVNTNNSVIYGLKGIFGGFYGRFSLLPYFLKLREYNDLESRDLWEFELNFNNEEIELFEAHLWDMNLALFDYYYFTENCSYHIYRFIDAIKPKWNLWSETYSYLVPMDTIIPLVKKKEVLKSIYIRESIQKRAYAKLKKLSDVELDFIKKSINKKKVVGLDRIENKVKVLESLIEFLDYKFSKKIYLKEDTDINKFKMEVLKLRSTFKTSDSEQIKKKIERFDYGHRPRRLKISYLNSSNVKGFEFEDRTALHNILEPRGNAYSDFSLEMGRISFQYDENDKEIFFNRFTLANVTALRPFSYLEKLMSWTFSFGVKRDETYRDQLGVFLNLGLGAAFKYKRLVVSTFLQTYLNEFGREDKLQDRLVGPRVMLNMNFEKLSFQLDYEYLYNLKSNSDNYFSNLKLNSQYNFTLNHGVSLLAQKELDLDKFLLSYIYYY
jgi:hypothetical protein